MEDENEDEEKPMRFDVVGKVLSSKKVSVITRFWTNPEVGRKRDGLRGLHVEDL
jgi:hypothetical protein